MMWVSCLTVDRLARRRRAAPSTGSISSSNQPASRACLGVHVRAVAELVGLLAGDLVAPAQLLGGVGHRHLGAGIVEAHQQRSPAGASPGGRPLTSTGPYFCTAAPTLLPAVVVEAERVLHALAAADDHEGPLLVVAHAGQHHLGSRRRPPRRRCRRCAPRSAPARRRRARRASACPGRRRSSRGGCAGPCPSPRGRSGSCRSGCCSSVALMAMPPSWVAVKREKSPGSWLLIRMSARGVRRAPSRMTMDSLLAHDRPPLLVQEDRRDAGTVLDEVRHADVVVDGLLAAREARRPRPRAPRRAACSGPRGRRRTRIASMASEWWPMSTVGQLVRHGHRLRVDRRQLDLAREVLRGSAPWPRPRRRPPARRAPSPTRRPPWRRPGGRCAAGRAPRSRPMSRGSRWVPP